MADIRVIQNTTQIWDLLKGFASNTIDPNTVDLRFNEFPKIELVFDGPLYRSTLNTRTMEALFAIQEEIYRIYGLAVYNDEHYKLSKEEKSDLELLFKIRQGSTGSIAENIGEVLNKIIEKAMHKMEPRHVITIVGVVVAGWVTKELGTKVIDAVNDQQAAQIELTTEVERQNAENERLQIISTLINQTPQARRALEIQDETIESVAKSVRGPNEKVVLPNETEITEVVAKELYPRSKRRKAEDTRMDGNYYVESFTRPNDEVKVMLRSLDGHTFQAALGSLSQDEIDTIAWAAGLSTRQISLKVNAKDFEGDKRDLVIVGAERSANTAIAVENTAKSP